MRLVARLLAPLVCATAFAVVPATAAHAGCADDLIAAINPGGITFNIPPDRYVEIDGIDVTVHTGNVVTDALTITFIVESVVFYVVFATPAALVAFVNCTNA